MEQRTKEDDAAWRGFEDLKAWQLARELMIECHRLADTLPAKERYDLASKIVMSNIAEGYGRYHYLDSLRFYYIARGSLDETISHVIAAHDLTYIDDARSRVLQDLGRKAERTLNGYINYVRKLKGRATYGDRYIHTPDVTSGVLKEE
jgi:four helix bundle protein